mgnify:CR=1 FL=1
MNTDRLLLYILFPQDFDYPGIGPEHAMLHDTGRATYVPVTDDEAVDAFEYLSRTEGIIPAIESAHAVAYAKKLAPTMGKGQIIVINIPEEETKTAQRSHATEGRIFMTKIRDAFKDGKAFIPFLTCGDPDLETTENWYALWQRQVQT